MCVFSIIKIGRGQDLVERHREDKVASRAVLLDVLVTEGDVHEDDHDGVVLRNCEGACEQLAGYAGDEWKDGCRSDIDSSQELPKGKYEGRVQLGVGKN